MGTVGWEGRKKEIHLAGKRKAGQMSKSAKMKLIGSRWIPPVAILWMLDKGPERVGVLPHAPLVRERAKTTIWGIFNFHPPNSRQNSLSTHLIRAHPFKNCPTVLYCTVVVDWSVNPWGFFLPYLLMIHWREVTQTLGFNDWANRTT